MLKNSSTYLTNLTTFVYVYVEPAEGKPFSPGKLMVYTASTKEDTLDSTQCQSIPCCVYVHAYNQNDMQIVNRTQTVTENHSEDQLPG